MWLPLFSSAHTLKADESRLQLAPASPQCAPRQGFLPPNHLTLWHRQVSLITPQPSTGDTVGNRVHQRLQMVLWYSVYMLPYQSASFPLDLWLSITATSPYFSSRKRTMANGLWSAFSCALHPQILHVAAAGRELPAGQQHGSSMARSARPPPLLPLTPQGWTHPLSPLAAPWQGSVLLLRVSHAGDTWLHFRHRQGQVYLFEHIPSRSRWSCPGCFLHMQRCGRVTRCEEGPPLCPTHSWGPSTSRGAAVCHRPPHPPSCCLTPHSLRRAGPRLWPPDPLRQGPQPGPAAPAPPCPDPPLSISKPRQAFGLQADFL